MADTISPLEALEKAGIRAASLKRVEGSSEWALELNAEDMPSADSASDMHGILCDMTDDAKQETGASVGFKPLSVEERAYVFLGSWADVTTFAAFVQFGTTTLGENVTRKIVSLEGEVVP